MIGAFRCCRYQRADGIEIDAHHAGCQPTLTDGLRSIGVGVRNYDHYVDLLRKERRGARSVRCSGSKGGIERYQGLPCSGHGALRSGLFVKPYEFTRPVSV